MSEQNTAEAAGRQPPIAYVAVVGFHHQKGNQLEYVYPTSEGLCPAVDDGFSPVTALPKEWVALPFVAIPDGAHACESDFVYFRVPCPGDVSQPLLYGIACYRQVDSSAVTVAAEGMTRSRIQKSVVILSRVACYGAIRQQCDIITRAYFAQNDFSQRAVLMELFHALNASLATRLDETRLHLGLSVGGLVRRLRHRLLALFKAMLLERRVVIHALPAGRVSTCVVSLASLLPGYLMSEEGGGVASGAPAPSPSRSQAARQELWEAVGLPLLPFHDQYPLRPYVALQQLGDLTEARGFLIGVTNMHMMRSGALRPAVSVDINKGRVEMDEELAGVVEPTTADLKFIDDIVRAVEEVDQGPGDPLDVSGVAFGEASQRGSDEWVRAQFEAYLVAFLSAAAAAPAKDIFGGTADVVVDFGAQWASVWTQTRSYNRWCKSIIRGAGKAMPSYAHPAGEDANIVEDISIRLASRVHDMHVGERFGHFMESSGLSSSFTKMRNFASDLWTEPQAKEETEAGEEAKDPKETSFSAPAVVTMDRDSPSAPAPAARSVGGYFSSFMSAVSDAAVKLRDRLEDTFAELDETTDKPGGAKKTADRASPASGDRPIAAEGQASTGATTTTAAAAGSLSPDAPMTASTSAPAPASAPAVAPSTAAVEPAAAPAVSTVTGGGTGMEVAAGATSKQSDAPVS